MANITGYYSQLHFQLNELELYYNFPVIQNETDDKEFNPCPYISNLLCSRAHELAPKKCITERECELYFNKDELVSENGIHAPTLQRIDKELRES